MKHGASDLRYLTSRQGPLAIFWVLYRSFDTTETIRPLPVHRNMLHASRTATRTSRYCSSCGTKPVHGHHGTMTTGISGPLTWTSSCYTSLAVKKARNCGHFATRGTSHPKTVKSVAELGWPGFGRATTAASRASFPSLIPFFFVTPHSLPSPLLSSLLATPSTRFVSTSIFSLLLCVLPPHSSSTGKPPPLL